MKLSAPKVAETTTPPTFVEGISLAVECGQGDASNIINRLANPKLMGLHVTTTRGTPYAKSQLMLTEQQMGQHIA
ncbi:hypothetical protein V6N13_072448 [Hibiscus sabdariffa]|uniref:Uncharacterized protein n=1 Tax=Hibiscus sabdariffa TaxID=183260 RepID=A0ABR2R7K6_9ROSI